MNTQDFALSFAYPRLLAAAYYGLLSVVGTILIDALLTTLGIEEMVPLFQAIILGMVVASITGALFGKSIIYCQTPYKLKTFFIGFSMVLLSLPFFDLGLVLFMYESDKQVLKIINAHDLVSAYFIVLGYSYIFFGFLLALAAGLASIYLRDCMVYHVLDTDKRRNLLVPRYLARKNKIKHSHHTRTMRRKKT